MSSHRADQAQDQYGVVPSGSDAVACELIELLGLEGARRMCRDYAWDGMARAIERVSSPHFEV